MREIAGQALRFGAVGIVNTAVGLGTILAVQWLTPAGPFLANACGYALGLSVSFALNRRWTFAATGRAGRQVPRFLAVFALAYALNLAVLKGALGLGASPALAQLPALAAYSASFFLLSRLFVFR